MLDATTARAATAGAPARDGLRVAVFSDAKPERNGVGAYYRDLLEQLEGYEVTAELFCPGGAVRDWLRLPLPGDTTQSISFPSPRMLSRALRRLQPDAIICATPGPYGLMGSWMSRRLDTRLIIGFHTHYEKLTEIYWKSFFGKVTRWYFDVANRMLFRKNALVLANSEAVAEEARRMGAPEVQLMGTLVASDFLEPPTRLPADPVRDVLFAGRLAAEKNLDKFLDAAERLPELRFTIAGDGPQREMVETRASRLPNVRYLGWVARSELRGVMDAADMLVLPSKVESFGTVALEAMARQRLVLVSGDCGIVQWPSLSDGLCRIGEGECLTDAIARVVALSAADRAARAEAARGAACDLNRHSLHRWLELLRSDARA